jgi:hypothetical protein
MRYATRAQSSNTMMSCYAGKKQESKGIGLRRELVHLSVDGCQCRHSHVRSVYPCGYYCPIILCLVCQIYNHRTPKYLTNLGLGRFAVDSVQLLQ